MKISLEKKSDTKKGRQWWERPGFSIMYQIEARPGWIWNRNYDKFNASMMDDEGNIKFNGPFCKMKKWVEFSKKVGVDYHVFETKWHDGICYWDSNYTNWKTPEDYCKIFSEESKKAGIPFMWYYSAIFDHNPQFDAIQPLRCVTPSYIAMHNDDKKEISKYSLNFAKSILAISKPERKKRKIPYNIEFFDDVQEHDFIYNPEKYEDYLLNQIKELIEKYKPNGMWMDWYMGILENSTFLVMNFMEKTYPNVVLTYNNSVGQKLRWAYYLSGEAHNVESAWNQGNKYRNAEKPWELCGPAAYAWDVPLARPDPYEIFRIAVIIMASGGKYCFGLPSQMDGELYPEPAKNLETFGNWYKPRRILFTESIPMKYEGREVLGIEISEKDFGTIGSMNKDDTLIHLINFKGVKQELTVKFSKQRWKNVKKIILEPNKKELEYAKENDCIVLSLPADDVDLADTILRISI